MKTKNVSDVYSGNPPVWCYGCNGYVAKYERFPSPGGTCYKCPHCGHVHRMKVKVNGRNNK